jgi:5-methylcytosine-specific restriction endonuclease McrA
MNIIKRILAAFSGNNGNESRRDARSDTSQLSSESQSFDNKFSVLSPAKYGGVCICGCNGKKYNHTRSSHVDLNFYKKCPARLARKKNESLRSVYNVEKKKKDSWGKRDRVAASAQSKQEAIFRGLKTYTGTVCPTCRTATKTKHGFCKKCKASENKIRDAMRRGAYPEDLTSEERFQIIKIYDEAKKISLHTGIAHHVDHIKPLAKGGRHHPSNLQIITAEENLKKGAKWE